MKSVYSIFTLNTHVILGNTKYHNTVKLYYYSNVIKNRNTLNRLKYFAFKDIKHSINLISKEYIQMQRKNSQE